ncbi:cilia- and flagella-associated protein 57-like [Schistocerca cancellata]|uniref:cilia- and flagella-associated protein 57-like n=1 Tax=Schistocerca cancellata TaxID=274614 RepID=UPI002117E8FD|nr:cilia- and flagella-associated protein 57-like [Schistocerca cancellata]
MAATHFHPHLILGLKTGVKGNAQYIKGNNVLYPVGGVLALHNFKEKEQSYIRLEENEKALTMIHVSMDRTMAAIVYQTDERYISVYDLTTLKQKKVICVSPDIPGKEIVVACFTFDLKFLMVILGKPQWMLLCYELQTGDLKSSTQAINEDGTGEVYQAAPNPSDNTVICVVGPGLFRLLSVLDNSWTQYGYAMTEYVPFTCASWVTFDRLVCGTKDGRLIIFESGDLKYIYDMAETSLIDTKSFEELPPLTRPETETEEDVRNTEIREIVSGAKGFAYNYGESAVHFFERLSAHAYSKRNVFNIPCPEIAEREPGINCIQNLSMNNDGDYLVATTRYSQIYSAFLMGPTIAQQPEIEFDLLGESLHHGEINGLSTCRWKPIFITCGKADRTVRIWNYEEQKLTMSVQYQEDVYCVALHPTGLYATIGFSHKIRYVKVLIDDLESMRAFPIRSCVECAFSCNGHLFAAVNGNIIQIYSCITFQNVYTLKGHNGKIRSLAWIESDDKLVSCGTEGAVYEWYIPSTRRVGETIIKSCVFSGITVFSYGGSLFAVGSDGKLREISDSEVINEVDICEQLDCITITHDNSVLFISTSSGTIFSYPLPLTETPHPRKQAIHNHSITRMCITENNELLITCSTDGMLCLWSIAPSRRKKSAAVLSTLYFEYILVNKGHLEELTNSIAELNQRIGVLEKEYDYQTQQNEAKFTEELKEIVSSYQEFMENMREQSERVATDHAQELMSFKDDIAKKKSYYEIEVQNFELNFEAKLIEKYNKYQAQEDKMARTKARYEKQIGDILEEKKRAMSEIQQKYELKLHNKEMQIDDLLKETQDRVQEHESIVTQLEDEVDANVINIKEHFENLLEEEKIASAELRREIVGTKNKFKSVEKDVDEYRCQIQKMQNEQKTFKEMIELFEKDIVDIKTEIAERDISLAEKEKQLYTLTRDKQELEKINSILNYGIEELKNELPIKDNEIKSRMEQIRQMRNRQVQAGRNRCNYSDILGIVFGRIVQKDKYGCKFRCIARRRKVRCCCLAEVEPGEVSGMVAEISWSHDDDDDDDDDGQVFWCCARSRKLQQMCEEMIDPGGCL